MEYWELYDEHLQPVGKIIPRGSEVKKGEYYRISGVICINEEGQILVTKRAHNKKSHPNSWEFTCGTLEVGEEPLEAAIRELKEETGILTKKEDLVYLGCYQEEDKFSFIYFYPHLRKEEKLQLQKEEVSDMAFLDRKTFLEKCEKDFFAPPMRKRLLHFFNQYESYLK